MLNIDLIRRDPEQVRNALNLRGEVTSLDKVLELDAERRRMVATGDKLRAQRNQVSQDISKSKDKPPEIIEKIEIIEKNFNDYSCLFISLSLYKYSSSSVCLILSGSSGAYSLSGLLIPTTKSNSSIVNKSSP